MDQTNELSLRPINDLLKESFFIPAYQRGYRWTKRQVEDLLDDIYEFSNKESISKDEFYCLQPIVVKNRGETWELVDGQQRLTTIYLILKFFNSRFADDFQKKLYVIEYETRSDSREYLDSLDPDKKSKNIDFHHIYEAYEVIKIWFQDKFNRVNDIESVFLNRVQIIWYDVRENINPVEVFSRLNIGKIPLTNAELVKALILRGSNFKNDGEKVQQLKQFKIAHEWDEIEKRLQDDSFWFFISNKPAESNRIEFILKLLSDEFCEDPRLQADENYIFLIFNERISIQKVDAESLWQDIKKYFMRLYEWYTDRYTYHLIGYLISQGVEVSQIKKAVLACSTKTEFHSELKAKVFKQLFPSANLSTIKDDDLYEIIEEPLNELSYESLSSHRRIRAVLLFFNVATLQANETSIFRFPYDQFKKENWDIEHVRSVRSIRLGRTDDQKKWLLHVYEFAKDSSEKDVILLCEEIHKLLEADSYELKDFENLYERIIAFYDPDQNYEVDHSIGNLTLLDAGTNRSYKNAIFPIKRQRILDLDKSGTFVPLCTKNLFLKYFSKQIDTMLVWSISDSKAHQYAIQNSIYEFFKKNGVA